MSDTLGGGSDVSGQGGTFGYGQEALTDLGNEFNVISFIIRMAISRLSTMKVCKVVKVTPGAAGAGEAPGIAGTVDVQPLVNMIDGNANATPHGIVHGLPYLRLQSGTWAIVADPVVNDIGIVICSDRDISAVKSAKKQSNPGSRRMLDLADGVYICGILNSAPTSYFQLKEDGTFKIADRNGNVLQSGEDGFTFTGKLNVTGDVAVTGNIEATQAIAADGQVTAMRTGANIKLSTHLHTSGAAGTPTSTPTPGS